MPAKKPDLDLAAEAAAEGPIQSTEVVELAPAPNRPSITPAQLVAGIPILAELGHSFGLFELSQAQQDSLSKTVTWAFVLIGADALVRIGRNVAHALAR